MAKSKEELEGSKKTFTFDDFGADSDLLMSPEDEQEEEVDEEEELEEEKPKKFKKAKAKIEEEEESEEEEPKPKKKAKKEEIEEEEEETEEEETTESEEEEEIEDNSDQASKFFEEVEKLTGHEVEVEYGEVDPLSPQGVAIREKAVRESALDGFLEELEVKYPMVYKALQHADNGGDVADLFSVSSSRDYSKVDIGEKDEALATEILKEYFKSKGIKNEARIKKLVESAQDSDEGLIAEAKNVLEELKSEQEEKRNGILEDQKVKATEQKKRDQLMVTAVDEVLETGKLGNFKITSRQEAAEFKKFVVQNIRKIADGKYEVATPLDGANLERALQYQYFQYKKGDLSKLIQIKASSENAQKLKLKLKAEQSKQKKSGEGNNTSIGKLSFRDFES